MGHSSSESSRLAQSGQPTSTPATILLVYDDPPSQRCEIRETLQSIGHAVEGPLCADEQAIKNAQRSDLDLAVVRIRGDVDPAAEFISHLWNEQRLPSLAICSKPDIEPAARLVDAGAFIVVPDLTEPGPLGAGVLAVLRRAREMREMASRISQLERNLANRRLVEQAKWRLVRDRGMTEPDAHRWLQSTARNRRVRLEQVAREIAQDPNDM